MGPCGLFSQRGSFCFYLWIFWHACDDDDDRLSKTVYVAVSFLTSHSFQISLLPSLSLSICPPLLPVSFLHLSLLSIISLCRHLIIRFTSLHTVSLSLSISHSIHFLALSFFLIRPLNVFRSRRRLIIRFTSLHTVSLSLYLSLYSLFSSLFLSHSAFEGLSKSSSSSPPSQSSSDRFQ